MSYFFSCLISGLSLFSDCTIFNVEYLIHIFETALKLPLSILVVIQYFCNPEIMPNIVFTEK